ncbi:hypothetical protein CK203_053399 [Vitis vinifera]|uniref:Reverse transcriptase/retrotransposon-derived protein RNase H-like domain-containing protein n=1 Tax=Vitis vinifera TaxID=29760 RepID=A0A438GZU4_VITVI|nr:hypothetical protein CK203_053399 [Vitis vinifera]
MPFHGTQGIVLGHIISKKGIEVDKAKVELIVKLPSPTTVKGDAKFVWDDRCQQSFEELKLLLTTAPIVRAPNWQLPFEVMCDASDFAIGAVLGQREDGKPYVIYYASKTSKTRKEWKNVVADHLSRLAITHNSHSLPINDDFPEESLMLIEAAPCYTLPPQTSGQVELANRRSKHTDESGEYEQKRLSMAKQCHLPVEVQYKAWWAIKTLNMDLNRADMKRFLDLNEMEELRNDAYINSNIAKQRLKRWHDQLVSQKIPEGTKSLVYDSKLHIFPKVEVKVDRSVYYPTSVFKWSSRATQQYRSFKVNGQRLKPFLAIF